MSKYPSRYSDGKKVTAAQYITELIYEKRAVKDKKELPNNFWKLPQWAKIYKSQIFAAYGLLKIYDEVAIIKALKSKKSFNIYSLRAPHLDDIIKEEQRQLELDKNKPKTAELKRTNTSSKPREHKARQTKLGKLRELDL